jgi:histidinol-phosphate aminotransferase
VLFEGKLTGEAAFAGLMQRGFITRWLPGQALPHGLRITIGTQDEMERLVAALRDMIQAMP